MNTSDLAYYLQQHFFTELFEYSKDQIEEVIKEFLKQEEKEND